MNFICHKKWLGRGDLAETLKIQAQFASQAQSDSQFYMMGFEAETVITRGLRSHKEPLLETLSIPQLNVERGGEWTLHSPGQLIIFPVIPLKNLDLGAKAIVQLLMVTTKNCLESYNLEISCKENGLHTLDGKISSIGLSLKNKVLSHGISINISNDLELFKKIPSCGVWNRKVARLADYAPEASVSHFYEQWLDEFQQKFFELCSQRLTYS